MQTNYLKYFVDVARHGSISAAANINFISSQGMSRSLGVLETELGCKLFRRTSNKMVLNRYGEALLPYASEMLRAQADMLACVAELSADEQRGEDDGVVAYLNNVCFDSAFFGPLVDSFDEVSARARYFQCDNDEVVEKLLSSDEGDPVIGLLCLFSIDEERNAHFVRSLQQQGFKYQPYLHSYDEVLVSKGSDLAKRPALSRADILSKRLIVPKGDIRRVVESKFGSDAISMVTSDNSFRFKVVAADEAISVVPAFYKLLDPLNIMRDNDLATVPMKDPYYLEIGFAARPEVLDSLFIKDFFSKLNSSYLAFSNSQYMTLITSDLTVYRPDGTFDERSDAESLNAIEDRFGISPRERDVFECLAEGDTAMAIADKLYISTATAKSHIYSIYKKLGIHSQNQLLGIVEAGKRS